MKLLCGSDFHGTMPKKIKEVISKEKPVAMLYAGDMPPHPWDDGTLEDVTEGLASLEVPVYAVAGNMDDPEYLKLLDISNPSFNYLGMQKVEIDGFTLVGFTDYSMPLPFAFKNLMTEVFEKFENALKGCDPMKTIIVNHVPPKDTKVDFATAWGFDEHAGDDALRAVIEKFQPLLVVCGHIHEAKGTDKIGRTLILNTATTLSVVELEAGTEPTITFYDEPAADGAKGRKKQAKKKQ
ncbi:MAG: metallophosphoesterase family protein [Candidatus Aenigmarchaeota archaeon]|nr:metallophosphoesterase family protein [Candidatus Aenigmarchaeota archaeon]